MLINNGNIFFNKTFNSINIGNNKNNFGKSEYKNRKMILPSKENYPLNNNFNVNRTLKPKEKYNEQNKNIKEIKVKFFAGEKKNNIIIQNKHKNDIFIKIIYIQRWWRILHKKIIMKKEKDISYLINKINKLFFKNLLNKLREKIKFYEKNAEQLNENNNNSKKNINKKLKKYETSAKHNKKMNFINNSLLNASKTNRNILIKKLEIHKNARNNDIKSLYSGSSLSSLSTININKKTKYILLNNISNDNHIKDNNNDKKGKRNFKNKVSNEEKLNAYNNIFNIYNNVKKIYENNNKNKNNLYKANTTYQNFYKKNSFHKKEKKEIKMNKKLDKSNITNKKNDISVFINKDYKKREKNRKVKNINNKESTHLINFDGLTKSFVFWKEYSDKKNIIKKLKMLSPEKDIFKNKIKDKEKKRETLSITTKKINLSNSIIKQRLCLISPRELNYKKNNEINNKQAIYNYASKKVISNKNKNENSTLNGEGKIYHLSVVVDLFDKKNEINKIKKYFNKWKILIKLNKDNFKGIEEKIINFKKNKSIFKNSNNSQLNIFNRNRNFIYPNNNIPFCQTESNINFPSMHIRNNSTNYLSNQILTSLNFSKDKLNEGYINMNTHEIVYKRKLLIDEKKRKKLKNLNEERNLTLEHNYDANTLNLSETNFYGENKKIFHNSIYGGKFFENKFENIYKSNKKIEEREICFTPNKKNNFNNNFEINVNIVENYLNKGFQKNKIGNCNCDNKGIKTKQIIFK